MKIDLAILQIALIFFPGIVWAALHGRFVVRQKLSNFQFVLYAFIFGIVSYVVTGSVYSIFGEQIPVMAYLSAADKSELPNELFSFRDLAAATVIALVLAIAWIYLETYKLAARLLQFIKATKKSGDVDVWNFTLNSSKPEVEYVQVRDFGKEIVYSGWIDMFSEAAHIRELLLRDVQIYDFAGNFLYEMPHVYIARAVDDIQLDFPYRSQEPVNLEK
jgi:hypothetical protein